MDEETAHNISDQRQLAHVGRSLISGKNSRIGNGMAAVLMLFATVAELLTLIPFAGAIVGPLFWIGAGIYLWHKGCGFLKVGRLVTEAISFIAEMIPVVQELPTIIVGMAIVIALIRLEDKTGVSVMKRFGGKQGRVPLNAGGVRRPQAEEEELAGAPRNQNTRPLNIEGVRYPSDR
ncbi:MAG: hypothetical protein JWO00_157 [Candidatus Parcubacteria bacterium]|nr:hypothetical protein [Candidatus Parcubacteria bacterium]